MDSHSAQREDSEASIHGSQQREQVNESRLNTVVQMSLMKKQSLAVTFSGNILSGVFKDDYTLCIQYSFYSGNDWELVGGQPSGISHKSISSEEKIIWNFPFGVTFQTKNIMGWPQIVVIIYGTDYYGRSIPKGYGNIHLPMKEGIHHRKMRIFKPVQPKPILNCLNWITSSPLQIKQAENFFGQGTQRRLLKVEYGGEIQLQIETRPINLSRHKYK